MITTVKHVFLKKLERHTKPLDVMISVWPVGWGHTGSARERPRYWSCSWVWCSPSSVSTTGAPQV